MLLLLAAAGSRWKTSGSPALIALVLGVVGAIFLWLAIAALRRRHRMVSTETSAIADAPRGFAELHGRVTAIEELTSPYSQARCVHYSFKVQERRSRKNGTHWVTIRHGTRSVDFAVDDATGRALVRPAGADFVLKGDASARSGTFNDPTPSLATFFASVNVDPTSFFGLNRGLRVEETFLADGDEVYLMGRVRACGKAEGGSSGATLVMSAGGPDFLISDQGEAHLTGSLLVRGIFLGILGLALWGGAFALAGLGASGHP